MLALRHRLSNVLIRIGTERTLDRRQLECSMARVPRQNAGLDAAAGALLLAACVDDAMLWLGWRLRPSMIGEDRGC